MILPVAPVSLRLRYTSLSPLAKLSGKEFQQADYYNTFVR